MYYSVACEAMHPDTFVFLFHTSEDRIGPVTPFLERAFVFNDTDNEHLMLQKDFADARAEERVCGQAAIKRVLIAEGADRIITGWNPNTWCKAPGHNIFWHEFDFMTIKDFYESDPEVINFHAEVKRRYEAGHGKD